MSSPNVYPAAFSLTGPDITALVGGYFSGAVYWVSSATGNDANAGTEPELPKATLTNAIATGAAGDLVLIQPSHVETISVADTLSKAGMTIVGLGLGTTRPRLTSAVAGAMWTVTGAYTRLYNLYFPASTAATTARIAVTTGEAALVNGCYFECGTNDTTNCITVADNDVLIESSDFVATASRPARGVNVTGAVTGFRMKDVLFDGGAFGWSSKAFDVNAAATRMFFENVRLANRSDFVITTTGTSYHGFGVRTVDNTGSRVVIAA